MDSQALPHALADEVESDMFLTDMARLQRDLGQFRCLNIPNRRSPVLDLRTAVPIPNVSEIMAGTSQRCLLVNGNLRVVERDLSISRSILRRRYIDASRRFRKMRIEREAEWSKHDQTDPPSKASGLTAAKPEPLITDKRKRSPLSIYCASTDDIELLQNTTAVSDTGADQVSSVRSNSGHQSQHDSPTEWTEPVYFTDDLYVDLYGHFIVLSHERRPSGYVSWLFKKHFERLGQGFPLPTAPMVPMRFTHTRETGHINEPSNGARQSAHPIRNRQSISEDETSNPNDADDEHFSEDEYDSDSDSDSDDDSDDDDYVTYSRNISSRSSHIQETTTDRATAASLGIDLLASPRTPRLVPRSRSEMPHSLELPRSSLAITPSSETDCATNDEFTPFPSVRQVYDEILQRLTLLIRSMERDLYFVAGRHYHLRTRENIPKHEFARIVQDIAVTIDELRLKVTGALDLLIELKQVSGKASS